MDNRGVTSGELPDVGAFGAAFSDFVQAMAIAAERPGSALAVRLEQHLGEDAAGLPSTVAERPTTERATLQLALDDVTAGADLVGFGGGRHLTMMGRRR
jgi:hypothetical protein